MARLDETIARLKIAEELDEGPLRVTVNNKPLRLCTQAELNMIELVYQLDEIYGDTRTIHSVFMWLIRQLKNGAVPICPNERKSNAKSS